MKKQIIISFILAFLLISIGFLFDSDEVQISLSVQVFEIVAMFFMLSFILFMLQIGIKYIFKFVK